jgi:hypothetical protein
VSDNRGSVSFCARTPPAFKCVVIDLTWLSPVRANSEADESSTNVKKVPSTRGVIEGKREGESNNVTAEKRNQVADLS